MTLRLCFVLALLGTGLSGAASLYAGPWNSSSDSFAYDVYPNSVGAGTVLTTLQTSDGYLWVGTTSGLQRFDGVRFTPVALPAPAHPGEAVHCLHEDRQHALWIGTSRGLLRLQGGSLERIDALTFAVRALAENSAGDLFIPTMGGGLWRWTRGSCSRVVTSFIPETSSVRTAFVDSRDRLWLALDRGRGAVCLSQGEGRLYELTANFSEILTIREWPRDTVWFGTQRQGVFRLHDETLAPISGDNAPRGAVTDLCVMRDGSLWIAAGALYRVNSQEQPRLERIADTPNDNIRALTEDNERGLWLSAGAEGLIRMRTMQYRAFTTDEGLPSNNVKTVSADGSGNLWLGVQHVGVVQVTPAGNVLRQDETVGLAAVDPAAVFAATDGTVWAATNSRLFVRRDGKWSRFSDLRHVRGLYEDRQHQLWVGTEAMGLYRVQNDTVISVTQSGGAPIPMATSFAEDERGTVYVGTWRSGVFRIRGAEVTQLDRAQGLPSDDVRAVHVDGAGALWVGLAGRGLAVWHEGRWLNPDALVASVSGQVSAIAEDARGHLWLGTPAGILWAHRIDLLAAAKGERTNPAVHLLAPGSDSRSVPVWSGAQPIVWSTHRNELLFATRRGVVIVDPSRTASNDVAPPVQIERVQVDRRDVALTPRLEVPANARSLAIEFTALSFVQPGQVAFRYRLQGFDSDWVDAGTRRSAVYSRLPPGAYTFHVIAANSDGVWNTDGTVLQLVQLPHFYETRWFVAVVVLTGLLAMWGIYRWSHAALRRRVERLEQERAMENERRRIAQDLHDDLGARLTEIGLCAETALRSVPAAAKPELSLLSERVRQVVTALDAIVWAVNPRNDSLDELVAYLAAMYQEMFRRSSIRARLDLVAEVPAAPLDADQRSNLYLAAKELMNNVLKHSHATEAWLRIRFADGELQIVVEDNGRGFDVDASTDGGADGLLNIRRRLNQVGGAFECETKPGTGTKSVLRISLSALRSAAHRPHLP